MGALTSASDSGFTQQGPHDRHSEDRKDRFEAGMKRNLTLKRITLHLNGVSWEENPA